MALLAVATLLRAQPGERPPAHLTPAQWREDVTYFGRELPILHKNLFFHLSKADFDRQIGQLSNAAATASELEMKAGLARIMASVGDSHSWIEALTSSRQLELRFRQFPEGWYCVEARDDMAEAVGARLIAVAGAPVEETVRRLLAFVPQENPTQTQEAVAGLLTWPRALEAAGLPVPGDNVAFEFERAGRRFTIRASSPVRLAPGEFSRRHDIRRTPAGATFQPPLYRSDPTAFYWFRTLPSGTLYIQYNRCAEDPEQPMKGFAAEVGRTIAQKRPARIVVDLRNNGGGNSRVFRPLLDVLRGQKGRIFVAIGRGTYGSGAFNVLDLKDYARAKTVGEPTADKPNSFGEQRPFVLPNSRLRVVYATRYFRLVKNADPPSWEPDQKVTLTAADFLAGRDPVLEWIERQ